MHDPMFDNEELIADLDAEEEQNSAARAVRHTTMARRLVERKDQLELAKAAAKTAQEDFDKAQAEFWEMLDDEAMPTVTLDLGEPYGRVQFQKRQTIRSRIIDKDQAAESLRAAGQEYMLEPVGFRKRPLNQFVSECLRTGDKIPPGVGFSRTPFVTITRR